MRGEEFLFAAEQLLRVPNEATYRSAVSRSYCKKSPNLCNRIRQGIREYEKKLKA